MYEIYSFGFYSELHDCWMDENVVVSQQGKMRRMYWGANIWDIKEMQRRKREWMRVLSEIWWGFLFFIVDFIVCLTLIWKDNMSIHPPRKTSQKMFPFLFTFTILSVHKAPKYWLLCTFFSPLSEIFTPLCFARLLNDIKKSLKGLFKK